MPLVLAVPVLPPAATQCHTPGCPRCRPVQPCRPISGQAVPSRGRICQGEQPPTAGAGLGPGDNGAVWDLCRNSAPPPSLLSAPRGLAQPSTGHHPRHCQGDTSVPRHSTAMSGHSSADRGLCAAQRWAHAVYSTGLLITPLSRCCQLPLSQTPLQMPSQTLLRCHRGLWCEPKAQAAQPLAHLPAPQHRHPSAGPPDQCASQSVPLAVWPISKMQAG